MKVCIGIVTHNRADILPKAINSALSQDYPNKEVVVFDDASNDGTPDLRVRYPSVIWKRSEKPIGLRDGRNRMMRETDADAFCSLDDDSWFLEENALSEGVRILENRPNIGAIAYDILDSNNPNASERGTLERVSLFIGCGHLLRLASVKKAGYYAELPGSYGGEEKDLSIQMIDLGSDVLLMHGVCVWHDKTMQTRDVRRQHRSGVCNDLVFAFRRCPMPLAIWTIPAKIISNLRFAIGFSLRSQASKHEYDRKVTNQIGRFGFIWPSLEGIFRFFASLPKLLASRKAVSADTYRKVTRRARFGGPLTFHQQIDSVTISIATRNRRQDLAETLRELRNLDPKPNEIIVCADGCSDDTVSYVRENHPECTLLVNNEWEGSVSARDQIFRIASGELIVSLDDDSFPLQSDFISRMFQVFNAHPEIGILTFPQISEEYPESFSRDAPSHSLELKTYKDSGASIRRALYRHLPGYPSFFKHAYEEPDFSIQCHSRDSQIVLDPNYTIRHRYTAAERNELHTHRFHARNEIWSILLRCPWWLVLPVAAVRLACQFLYAVGRGPRWALTEPIWWIRCLSGVPKAIAHRKSVPTCAYLSWLKRPPKVQKVVLLPHNGKSHNATPDSA
ncbi:MAG: glycosyltransferase [Verrucomicrobiota bacterium]